MEQSNALAPSFELDRANQRFILTQLGEMTLVFPSHLVAETLLVERTQILSLPFYDPLVLGCVHSGGQIVPLVDMHLLIGIRMSLVREVLTIVRLGDRQRNYQAWA
jgi:chemotaxis signal transduction protein